MGRFASVVLVLILVLGISSCYFRPSFNDEDFDDLIPVESEETVLLDVFSNIDISTEGSITITISNSEDGSEYITFKGNRQFLNNSYYGVIDNKLVVRQVSRNNSGLNLEGASIHIVVAMEQLDEFIYDSAGANKLNVSPLIETAVIDVAGAGEMVFNDVRNLDLEISGAASAEFLNVDNFNVDLAGAGIVRIESVTGNGNFEAAGAGEMRVGECTMGDLTLNFAGAGKFVSDASVNDLNVDIAGSGTVSVKEVRGEQNFDDNIFSRINIG